MLAAKVAGVEGVFVDKVIDGRCGLLQPDGAPAELFLPWRTTALALQGAEYLGEIQFPGKSRNAVFAAIMKWSSSFGTTLPTRNRSNSIWAGMSWSRPVGRTTPLESSSKADDLRQLDS
ncbi:MAG: hypothetical protein U0872_15055 [Planctomycetaceae bacterium]